MASMKIKGVTIQTRERSSLNVGSWASGNSMQIQLDICLVSNGPQTMLLSGGVHLWIRTRG